MCSRKIQMVPQIQTKNGALRVNDFRINGVAASSWFSELDIPITADAAIQKKAAELLIDRLRPTAERAELVIEVPSMPPGVMGMLVPRTNVYIRARGLRKLSVEVFIVAVVSHLTGTPPLTNALIVALSRLWDNLGKLSDSELGIYLLLQLSATSDGESIYDKKFDMERLFGDWSETDRVAGEAAISALKARKLLEGPDTGFRVVR